MTRRAPDTRFACPFCQGASVVVIGRGGRFVHYRCAACAEFWTGMKFPEPLPNWGPPKGEGRKIARRH